MGKTEMTREVDISGRLNEGEQKFSSQIPLEWFSNEKHAPTQGMIFVLYRFRGTFVAAVLLAILSGMALFAVTPKLFESKAKFLVGHTAAFVQNMDKTRTDPTPLEDMQNIRLKLKDARYEAAQESDQNSAFISDVKVQERAVEVSALGSSPEFVQKYLNDLLAELVSKHDGLVADWKNQHDVQIASMEKEAEDLKTTSNLFMKQTQLPNFSNEQKFLFRLEHQNLETAIRGMRAEQRKLKTLELGIFTQPTVVLKKATLPKRPASPVFFLYFAIAAMAGITLGIAVCFGRYSWELAKASEKK